MDKCKNAYNPSKVSMYIDSQKNKTLMDNYYTIDEINDILDGKIDLDSVYTKDETYNRGELYTREEVEYLLSLKANKVDVYSKIDSKTLLDLKENLSNKIQEINSGSTDVQYPSAKAVVNYTTDNYGDVIITTSELLILKNESKLVPGRHYRIIDYKPVFIHNSARWCEHQYDLVVRATSINEFSNKADAMLHDGDNYFSLCNIDNWKLSVDVFCDGSLYEWVKPLYCFKDSEDILIYTLTTDLLLETKLYTETGTEIINETIGSWFGSVEDANNSRLVSGDITTFIVVNEMIDEFENKAGYDFKSVIFNQTHQYTSILYNYGSYYKETIGGINLSTIFLNADRTVAGTCLDLFGTIPAAYMSRNVDNDITQLIDVKDEFYTFNTSPISTGSTSTIPMDNTVVSGLYSGEAQPHIYSNLNIIEDYYSTQFRLPINAICGTAFKNIFKGSARNTISEDLHHSEIYENVRNVNIGKGSYEISIGYNTQSVIIGKSSYGIQVGQGITSGTVGSSCKYCVIGDDSDNFVLGNNNDNVIIGKANKLITIDAGCDNTIVEHNNSGITISSNSIGCIIGSKNRNIVIGSGCKNAILGNENYDITIGSGSINCKIGNNSNTISIGNNCSSTTINDNVKTVEIGSNCSNNAILRGGNKIYLKSLENNPTKTTRYCKIGRDADTISLYGCSHSSIGNNTYDITANYIDYSEIGDDCGNLQDLNGLTDVDGNYITPLIYLNVISRVSGLRLINYPEQLAGQLYPTYIVTDKTSHIIPESPNYIKYLVYSLNNGLITGYSTDDNGVTWTEITIGGSGEMLVDILYSDLVQMRDSSSLLPGQKYRIIDYTTTTVQANTTSAGHDFDVIVTALSTNELSEIASCVRKSDDTYFENANLETWEIKYCIDNDTSRFAWADTTNGKGVIYYMKDEWNNECPYDFKNIQFKKSNVFLYTFGGATDNSLTGGCHHNTMMDYVLSSVLKLNFNTFGNNCYSNTFGNNCYSNTFGSGCYSNTFGNNCYSNTFGSGCYSNKFGDNCYSNTFGVNSYYNTFGNDCSFNTFGNNCYSNTFGNDCGSNTFSYGCQSNTFGDSCNSNRLGGYSYSNTFGNFNSSSTFGNGCYSNTFGDNCSSNTFGNDCGSNTFGDNYNSNNFYAGASGTTKKDFIRYIVLEDGCSRNNFYSTLTTSGTSYLQRIRIKGLDNTAPTNTQILLSSVNTNYEWVICYTSGNVLKQYCPDD